MGVLVSTGCSNTVGVDLEEEIGYENHWWQKDYTREDVEIVRKHREENNFSMLIAKKLQYECVNIAEPGNSNGNMLRKLVDYIEENPKVDFALINLTSASRISYKVDDEIHHFNLAFTPKELKSMSKIKHKNFEPFIDFMRTHCLNTWNIRNRIIYEIRCVISYLTTKNIPFFISTTIPNNVDLSLLTEHSINVSMDEFSHASGHKRLKGGHYGSGAHKDWADHIYKNIKKLTA